MAGRDSDTDTGITRQGKGFFVGIIFIVWGLIGSVWPITAIPMCPFSLLSFGFPSALASSVGIHLARQFEATEGASGEHS
jgi:hypothetical protein